MLTQTSDTWWHFFTSFYQERLVPHRKDRNLQRCRPPTPPSHARGRKGPAVRWWRWNSSKIGIAVLIFSFNLSIFVSCSFQLEHLWTCASFPRLGRESVWSPKPFSIKTLQQLTCHGPQVKYFPETERQRHRHLSRNLQKSWNLNPSRTESIDACELVWLQCFPSITNDCSRTQRSFEDTLEGSRALSSWITLLTNLVVAPGSSQENFRKICNIFCNTAFFEKSNIFPKKTKL